MDDTHFLNKLPCSDQSHIIIETIWNPDHNITVNILSCNDILDTTSISGGHTGIISATNLKTTASHLEINFSDFIAETKAALTTAGGIANFQYQWDGVNGEFVWRKIKSEKLKIVYGRSILEVNTSAKDDILLRSLATNIECKQKIKEMNESFERFKVEYNELLTSNEDNIRAKNALEDTLLIRFISLLNTKKDKIKSLEDELAKVTDRLRKVTDLLAIKTGSGMGVKATGRPKSGSDSANNYTTDDSCGDDYDERHHNNQGTSSGSDGALAKRRGVAQKRLHSESSQSQEMSPVILPKRDKPVKATTTAAMLSEDCVAGPSWRQYEYETSQKKPNLPDVTINPFDCDTQELINDM